MNLFKNYTIPFTPAKAYSTKVAYFSMEFAVDQSLKIFSGGLGFLAGSHMRSAYELEQNMIGIGILWKYGYSVSYIDNETGRGLDSKPPTSDQMVPWPVPGVTIVP